MGKRYSTFLPENDSESFPHRMAKHVVTKAAKSAGYTAIQEWSGRGWKTDVFCVKNNVRIAFEIQYSYQGFAQTMKRQAKLKSDGVRGCWLCREFPCDLEFELQELPLFKVDFTSRIYLIHLPGNPVPLYEGIQMLLNGRVKFDDSQRQWVLYES